MPKFLTFKGFFSWIYITKGPNTIRSASVCVVSPSACRSNGCMETYDVDTNDLAIGLFNLLQLSVDVSTRVQEDYPWG